MRRMLSVVIALMTVALTVIAAPASADEAADTDVKPDKVAAVAAIDFPEIDHAVALHCRGGVTDRGPAVSCGWRADERLEIAGWQLWRLQIRPARDGRKLVAELGAAVTSYVDTTVSSPAVYLYVVLGLDPADEIVARSRPDLARVAEHPPPGIPLACQLQRSVSDTAVVSETSDVVAPALEAAIDVVAPELEPAIDVVAPDFKPAIGCRWERSDHADVRGYVVHRVVDGGRRTVIAEVGADATSIVDHNVAFGHRYTYMVSAFDHEGTVVAHSRAVSVGIPPWPHDWVIDRQTDRIPHRPSDEPTDRIPHRPSDEPTDRIPHRPSDEPTDRIPHRPSDEPTDRIPHRPSDEPTDRIPHRPSDEPTDRTPERETDHRGDEPTDRIPERETDRPSDEPTDRVTDRAVDANADLDNDLERLADRLPTDH